MVATGKEVGRVSIRVLANATKFREDLKKILTRVEATMDATIKVDADTTPFTDRVYKTRRDAEKKQVSLKVDAKTLEAKASITKAARNRDVNLFVRVAKTSLAKASATIASLSGGRLVGDLVKNVATSLSNLDRTLPKIAAVALTVASIGSAALTSVSGLFSLAGGLAQLAGLAPILPALLAGAAIGITTLIVALKDAPNQLASLKQSFTDLSTTIDSRYWDKAKQPIIDFVQSVLPQLTKGFGNVAGSLGTFTANLANSFKRTFGDNALVGMFDDLGRSVDIAAGGAAGFANIITRLGTVGASYLPQLAGFVVDLTNRFDVFLATAQGDGTLQAWVQGGIIALQALGSVVGSVVQILGGIGTAAGAGSGGLTALAGVLSTIAGIVNGPAFQVALTTIFTGAAAGAKGLASALGPIGSLIGTLAPLLGKILDLAGTTVGALVSQLAAALSQPAFSNGLDAFFNGITAGLSAIGPALPAVAAAFGTLAAFAGTLAGQLGQVLGTALTVLAPLLQTLLAALMPILPVLGGALVQALQLVIPQLTTLASDVFPALAAAIVQIIPQLVPLLGALAPLFVQLVEATLPIIPPFTNLITTLLPQITALIIELSPVILFLHDTLINLIQFALTPTQDAFANFADFLSGFGPVGQFFAGIINMIGGLLSGGLLGAINEVVSNIGNFGAIWGQIWGQAGSVVSNAIGTVSSAISGFISGAGSLLYSAGQSIVNGLANGIRAAVGAATGAIGSVMGAVADFLPHSPAKKGPFSGKGWTPFSGRALARGLATGIDAGRGDVVSATSRLMSATANRVGGVSSSMDLSGALAGGGGVNVNIPITGIQDNDPVVVGTILGKQVVRGLRGH